MSIGTCCVIFYLFFGLSASHAELLHVIDQIVPSIVAVSTIQKTRQPSAVFLGTGFAIKNGHYIVTNTHVLPEILAAAELETLAVFSGRGELQKVRLATVIAKDSSDLILKTTCDPFPSLQLGNSDQVKVGD